MSCLRLLGSLISTLLLHLQCHWYLHSVYENDPDECIKQCQSLLDEPSLDTAVRMGDVYGLMIEHFGQAGSYEQVNSWVVGV